MSTWPAVRSVAVFEFLRVFKPKDALVTLALFVGGALFLAWAKGDESLEQAPITVIGDGLALENAAHLPFQFLPVGDSIGESEARAMIDSGDMGAALFVRGRSDVELLIRDETPDWYPQLAGVIADARRLEKMRTSGLTQAELDEVLADEPLKLSTQAPQDVERKRKLKFLASACLALMMMGLFVGSVHLFTGITGEKQNHVTESVLSAIPVQAWIDGKCLGATLASFMGLATMTASWMIANEIYGLVHEPLRLPLEIVDPGMFLAFLLIALLGFMMWFAFFAAVAATIDDPNTSSRGVFMFLPALVTGVGFLGADAPGSRLYRLSSVFPLTAPGAMPVRLISGNVAAWEVALSIALLVAATLAFRSLARKVFSMAMLMRGKELAWGEVWRAFRTPG